jgi:hypothetical protein
MSIKRRALAWHANTSSNLDEATHELRNEFIETFSNQTMYGSQPAWDKAVEDWFKEHKIILPEFLV